MRERDAGRSQDQDRHERDRQDRDLPRHEQARAQDRGRPLDRVRDAAEIRRRAELSREKERKHSRWGHAFREHVDATDEQLARRAAAGVNARGQQEDSIPDDATRWQSDAASVITTDRLWRTPEAQQVRNEIDYRIQAGLPTRHSFTVRAPLSKVLGPNWRDDVYGRSKSSHGLQATQWRTDSQAVAVFRKQADDGRWHLHTCYPQAIPYHRP